MIDETIKHVTHKINQTLLTSNTCNTSTNKISNNLLHNDTPDLDPTQDVNLHTTPTNTVKGIKQKTPTQVQHYILNHNVFNQTKQIIMDIDKLSHSTMLCSKILQSFNLNGLCKYDN